MEIFHLGGGVKNVLLLYFVFYAIVVINMIFIDFLIFFLFFLENVQESRGVNTVNRNFFQPGLSWVEKLPFFLLNCAQTPTIFNSSAASTQPIR